jgi:hypothetical protein
MWLAAVVTEQEAAVVCREREPVRTLEGGKLRFREPPK